MKISKMVRSDAAMICAIAAFSTEDGPNYDGITEDLGIPFCGQAHYLALTAWGHCMNAMGEKCRDGTWLRVADAEAESLLRTGWSPS